MQVRSALTPITEQNPLSQPPLTGTAEPNKVALNDARHLDSRSPSVYQTPRVLATIDSNPGEADFEQKVKLFYARLQWLGDDAAEFHDLVPTRTNIDQIFEQLSAIEVRSRLPHFEPLRALGEENETLEPGDGPSAPVYDLQRALNWLGYDLDITGVFDEHTVLTVQRYKETKHLKGAATVGPTTLKALFADLDPVASLDSLLRETAGLPDEYVDALIATVGERVAGSVVLPKPVSEELAREMYEELGFPETLGEDAFIFKTGGAKNVCALFVNYMRKNLGLTPLGVYLESAIAVRDAAKVLSQKVDRNDYQAGDVMVVVRHGRPFHVYLVVDRNQDDPVILGMSGRFLQVRDLNFLRNSEVEVYRTNF